MKAECREPPEAGRRQKQPPRGRDAPQFLEKDVLLCDRFRIVELLGGGGFGQIFLATDEEDLEKKVAVKVEVIGQESGRMVLEQAVLAMVKGCRNFPELFACGSLVDHNFIVMELLGRNLTEIRRKDIKPSNSCVGLPNSSRAYDAVLIDFGMARRYKEKDGSVKRARDYAAFRGTYRYVSIRVHQKKEQNPGDDIVSLFYTLVELAEGALPWRTRTEHVELIEEKMDTDPDQLCINTPKAFTELYHHGMDLDGLGMPDYNRLIQVLEQFHSHEKAKREMDMARQAFRNRCI